MKTLFSLALLLLLASVAHADTVTTSTWDFSGSAPGYTFSGSFTAEFDPSTMEQTWITAILGGEVNGEPITPQTFTPGVLPQAGEFCANGTFAECQGAAFTFLADGIDYTIAWNDSDAPNSGMDFDGEVMTSWTFTELPSVPEPSAALLLLVGLAFVAGIARRGLVAR